MMVIGGGSGDSQLKVERSKLKEKKEQYYCGERNSM
jgi:hypothetical protein